MAVTTSTRLGLTLWSAGADAFRRSQLDDSHQAMESKVVGFLQGVSRPAASASLQGFLYANISASPPLVSYCDGDEWVDFAGTGSFGSPTGLTVGGSNVDGVAEVAARSDHKHALPGWGAVVSLDGSSRNGVATTFARSDHTHAFEEGALSGAALGEDSVTSVELAPDSVGSSEIAANAVGTSEIATNAVGTSEIAPGAVGNSELGTDAVQSGNIATNAVTADAIASGAVGASEIATNAVGNAELASNAVQAVNIASNAVTETKIANGAVTNAKLGTDSVTAAKIAANAVGSSEIAANAVGSSEIAANAVGDSEIASLSASKLTGTLDDARLPAVFDTLELTLSKDLEIGGRATTANPTVQGVIEVIWDNSSNPSHTGITLMYDQAATTKTWMKFEFASGVDGGSLVGSGTSIGFAGPSDVRTKTDIRAYDHALKDLSQLDVIKYKRHGSERVGFSAQQVAEIPEFGRMVSVGVSEGYDDFHSLAESELIPYLTAGIQELALEIAELKAT